MRRRAVPCSAQGETDMRNVLGFLGSAQPSSGGIPAGAAANGAVPDNELLDSYSRAVVDVVEAVAPAVVHVGGRRRAQWAPGRRRRLRRHRLARRADPHQQPRHRWRQGDQRVAGRRALVRRAHSRPRRRTPILPCCAAKRTRRCRWRARQLEEPCAPDRSPSPSAIRSASSRPSRPASSAPSAARCGRRTAA